MSIEIITFLMLAILIWVILMGFPIGFSLAGVATVFGIILWGPRSAMYLCCGCTSPLPIIP